MKLFFFLLLSADLLLAAAVFRLAKCPPTDVPPSPASAPPAESRPDPVDEGFENIMRFTAGPHGRGGDFP